MAGRDEGEKISTPFFKLFTEGSTKSRSAAASASDKGADVRKVAAAALGVAAGTGGAVAGSILARTPGAAIGAILGSASGAAVGELTGDAIERATRRQDPSGAAKSASGPAVADMIAKARASALEAAQHAAEPVLGSPMDQGPAPEAAKSAGEIEERAVAKAATVKAAAAAEHPSAAAAAAALGVAGAVAGAAVGAAPGAAVGAGLGAVAGRFLARKSPPAASREPAPQKREG